MQRRGLMTYLQLPQEGLGSGETRSALASELFRSYLRRAAEEGEIANP